MRYISLDLETTGGDPLRHQIIELGAVVEDSKRPGPLAELPAFRRAVRHPDYVGTAGALALNVGLLRELDDNPHGPEVCTPEELVGQLQAFLLAQGFKADARGRVSVILAGKNIGSFDLPFLKRLPGWGQLVRAEPALLDPAAFYLNWRKDSRLPTMAICKARAKFEDQTVAHQAIADALDVIRLLRPFYELPAYRMIKAEND